MSAGEQNVIDINKKYSDRGNINNGYTAPPPSNKQTAPTNNTTPKQGDIVPKPDPNNRTNNGSNSDPLTFNYSPVSYYEYDMLNASKKEYNYIKDLIKKGTLTKDQIGNEIYSMNNRLTSINASILATGLLIQAGVQGAVALLPDLIKDRKEILYYRDNAINNPELYIANKTANFLKEIGEYGRNVSALILGMQANKANAAMATANLQAAENTRYATSKTTVQDNNNNYAQSYNAIANLLKQIQAAKDPAMRQSLLDTAFDMVQIDMQEKQREANAAQQDGQEQSSAVQ